MWPAPADCRSASPVRGPAGARRGLPSSGCGSTARRRAGSSPGGCGPCLRRPVRGPAPHARTLPCRRTALGGLRSDRQPATRRCVRSGCSGQGRLLLPAVPVPPQPAVAERLRSRRPQRSRPPWSAGALGVVVQVSAGTSTDGFGFRRSLCGESRVVGNRNLRGDGSPATGTGRCRCGPSGPQRRVGPRRHPRRARAPGPTRPAHRRRWV